MPDRDTVLKRCTNVLPGHGPKRTIAGWLRQVADGLGGDELPDVYGAGEYLADFGREVAELSGPAPAAVRRTGDPARSPPRSTSGRTAYSSISTRCGRS